MAKKIRLEDIVREMPNRLDESTYGEDSHDRDIMEHWANWFDEHAPTSWIPVTHERATGTKWTQEYDWQGRNITYRVTIEKIK